MSRKTDDSSDEGGHWEVTKKFPGVLELPLQLILTGNNSHVVSTFMQGFQVWNIDKSSCVTVNLPDGVRNISTKPLKSNTAVLSKNDEYLTAGVRKNLYVWSMGSGELLISLDAHFARIISMTSLTVGNWNSVVTSSIDRTVKVWNLNNIFEQVHEIDRHESNVDEIRYIISTESGNVIVWHVETKSVLFKEEQHSVKQIFFMDEDTKFGAVSRGGTVGEGKLQLIVRQIPDGSRIYEIEYPIRTFKAVAITSDGLNLIICGYEKMKDTLMVHHVKTGTLLQKIVPKYHNMKDWHTIIPMPNRASQVALIDPDKGNIVDIKTKRFIRSVPKWSGKCTNDGKYGLYAPTRGGLEIIELRHGKSVRTLIPKVAEGVFSNICMFTRTDAYVLYYHGGKNTLRVFRTQDGRMISNYRIQAELSAISTTEDGRYIVVGTVDGCLTVLAIADPAKADEMRKQLASLPSRVEEVRDDVGDGSDVDEISDEGVADVHLKGGRKKTSASPSPAVSPRHQPPETDNSTTADT
ncbi:unnamed protein product, partial [Cyprideis torosa]